MLSHVSQEVSRASHQVGFAIAPAADPTTLERLDFVPLDGGKLLVVVVARRRPRLAQGHRAASEEYEPGELQQAANYLNQRVQGAARCSTSGRPSSSGCARSGRSTTC